MIFFKNNKISSFFVIIFILVGSLARCQNVQAVTGEGAATIAVDGGSATSGVTVEQNTSHVFTVVLTVGASGITADAENPTFTIPDNFSVPSTTPVSSVGLVASGQDGSWFVVGGGTCLVDSPSVGLTVASGHVITVDVSTACTVGPGGTITLTYRGKSSTTTGANPLDIGVNDVISYLPVKSISLPPNNATLPTITVTDAIIPTVTISNNQSVATNIAAGNILYAFDFSEPVTGFLTGDITVGHGTKGAFTVVSSTHYTQVVTPEASFEGNLTVDVAGGVAFDTDGNGNATATQHVWTVDTLAPVVTSTAPANNTYIKANFSSSFSLSEDIASGTITFARTSGTPDGATHIYNLSGGNIFSGGHSVSRATLETGFGNSLVDGSVYNIIYNATDSSGNPSATVTNTGIFYDITAPSSTATIASSSYGLNTFIPTSTIHGTASDAGGIASVTITLQGSGCAGPGGYWGGGDWGTITHLPTTYNSGSGTWVYDATGLTQVCGPNFTITPTATDNAGNSVVGTADSFVIDNTRPTSTIDGFLSTIKATSRNQLITVTYSESMNPSSTPAIVFSGGSFVTSTAGSWSFSNTIWQQTFVDNADEEVVGVTVTSSGATDIVGNLEATSTHGFNNPFNIDTVAPTISIGLPSASLTATGSVTYIVTYSGASDVTLSNTDVALNVTGTVAADYNVTGTGTSTRTITLSNITGDGTLGISIAASTGADAVGNTALDAGPSTAFTVDNTPPSNLVATPAAGTYTSAQSVSLSSAGAANIYYTTDGSTPSCSVGTLYSGTIGVSSSEIIKAVGCDVAGNESSASFIYTISTNSGGGGSVPSAPPIVLSPSSVFGGVSTDKQNITLNFNVNNAVQVAISEDPNFDKVSWESYDSSKPFILSNGFGGKMVYVKFRSKDGGVTETFKVDANFVEKNTNSVPAISTPVVFEVTNLDSKIVVVPVSKLQYAPNSLVKYTYQYKNESDKTVKIKVIRQIVDVGGRVVNKVSANNSVAKNKIFKFNASNVIGSKLIDGIYTVQIKLMDAKTGVLLAENGFNITVKKPTIIKKVAVPAKKK